MLFYHQCFNMSTISFIPFASFYSYWANGIWTCGLKDFLGFRPSHILGFASWFSNVIAKCFCRVSENILAKFSLCSNAWLQREPVTSNAVGACNPTCSGSPLSNIQREPMLRQVLFFVNYQNSQTFANFSFEMLHQVTKK